MEEVFRLATAPMSVTMTMLGAASIIALLLGLVGIYGVISYLVGRRRAEIGVRMALGARPSEVRWMVVREGGRVAGAIVDADAKRVALESVAAPRIAVGLVLVVIGVQIVNVKSEAARVVVD